MDVQPSENAQTEQKVGEQETEQDDVKETNDSEPQENEVPDQSTQEELGSSDKEDSRIEEVTAKLREGSEGSPEELQGSEVEKRKTLDVAKESESWIEDLYSLGQPLKGGGVENTLALDTDNGYVYKSNNLFNSQSSVVRLLDQIKAHNEIFPETKYDLVGFTGF